MEVIYLVRYQIIISRAKLNLQQYIPDQTSVLGSKDCDEDTWLEPIVELLLMIYRDND